MENFEYSIQLSDKDWADFSAAAEECGLLQAALASGDEPLSSDIEQGDSSGSSPPGPPPPRLLRVRAGSPPTESLLAVLSGRPLAAAQGGCSGSEEEEGPDARLVSRFRCERVLAPGAGQQTQRTSTQLEEQLPSAVLCPEQLAPALLPQPGVQGGEMQKSSRGAAAQLAEAGGRSGKDPPGQEQPNSLVPADGKRSPREPNPGASPRSPGKKKRRSVAAKGSGSPKAQDSKRQGPPSPSLPLSGSQPDKGPSHLAPAGLEEDGPGAEPPAGAAGLGTRASCGADPLGPSSSPVPGPRPSPPAPGPEAGPAPPERPFSDLAPPASKTVNVSTPTPIPEAGENLSTPVSFPEKGVNLSGVASEAEPGCDPSIPVSKEKLHRNVFTPDNETNSEVGFPTPVPKSEPQRHRSTLVLLPEAEVPKAQPNVNMSTPAPQLQSAVDVSTPDLKAEPDRNPSASAPRARAAVDVSTPDLKAEPDRNPSASAPRARADVDVSTPDLKAEPDRNPSASAPRARADVDVSTPDLKAEPDRNRSASAPRARADVDVSTPAQVTKSFDSPAPREPQGEPEEGAPLSPGPPGAPSQGTAPATQSPGIAAPGRAPRRKKVRFSGVTSSPGEDSAPASPSADKAAPESPRTLGGGRGGPRAWDAVAVGSRPQPRILKHPPCPSALARESAGPREDFALTLPEAYDYFFCDTIVEEEEEEEEEDFPADVQWPEVCEYFFRDGRLPAPAPALQAPARGAPVPISIPEAYEHFFGEQELLAPADKQTRGPERAPLLVWPGGPAPEEQGPWKAEELGLSMSLEGEQRAPLIPITFNQNDMCLGFVAFATWAVRTSDLHAPDAWKTVLLANIGALSAIRYFRRQAREGRPNP
ncbi:PGC-1 and ERR-induced regulator in muscle protein 1 isoform X2 [Antechinus flavipes]|nr:PGC-1 and ERR-induced regulator in muscle protein 1 isoform X2 [Antechinus flavipes]